MSTAPERAREQTPAEKSPKLLDLKFAVTREQLNGLKEAARRRGFLSVAEYVRTTAWRDAVEVLNAPEPAQVQVAEPEPTAAEAGR